MGGKQKLGEANSLFNEDSSSFRGIYIMRYHYLRGGFLFARLLMDLQYLKMGILLFSA
jgi:hypothetical protein